MTRLRYRTAMATFRKSIATGLIAPVLALLIASCSTASTGTTTPGAPASVTIVSGDAQSAATGAVLPVALSVVVKDAAGVPVPGVTVQWAVTTGGGSLASMSSQTNPSGIATISVWTLGVAAGSNSVSATVSGLTPALFHAQGTSVAVRPLLTNLAVSTGGGVFRYSKPGDPLDGLTLTVPSGAYVGASQWTITTDSTKLPTLPAGFSLAAVPIVITTDQGYATTPITLTVPMVVGANTAVAPFYFNPSTNALEMIPLVDVTATSATLGALHFSGDFASWRTAGAGLRDAPSLRTFGSVTIVWVKASTDDLKGTFTTSYAPGVDDWEFSNYGDFIAPEGDCEGMGLTAIYYHYFKKSTLGSLYHKYDQSVTNQWDNIQGIRFAGSVQGDYATRWNAGVTSLQTLVKTAAAAHANLQALMSNSMMMTLKLTGKPILLAVRGAIGGHALVAYAGTSDGSHTVISFQDPNYPTTARSMTFESGVLTPIPLATNTTASADNFTEAYPLGVTAEVPLYQIDSRWTDFVAGTSGHDRYPTNTSWMFYNFDAGAYQPIPNGGVINTHRHLLFPSIFCTNCPVHYPSATDVATRQPTTTWDAAGANVVSTNGQTLVPVGTSNYVIEALAAPSDDPTHYGFLESISGLTVVFTPVATGGIMNVVLGGTQRAAAITGEVVQQGSTLALQALFRDIDSVTFTEATTWTSGTPAVASVDLASGVVTGVSGGVATITARSSSNPNTTVTQVVVVTSPNNNPPASMQITPNSWTMQAGGTKQFSATLLDSYGNPTSMPAGLAIGFAVDDSNIGSVVPTTGLLSAFRAGTTTIRAFLTGTGAPNISSAATLIVTP